MRFVCDVMLGRLVRYLRMLGLDAIYIKNYRELANIIKGSGEFCFLTKRTKNTPEGSVFIKADRVKEQIEEILPFISSYIDKNLLLCRCLDCNTVLVDREKTEVEGHIPEYVYHRHDRFKICPSCKKIYWGGTHTEHMEDWIRSLLDKTDKRL